MEDFDEFSEIFGEAYALISERNKMMEEEMSGVKLDDNSLENPARAAKAAHGRARDMKSQKSARDATLRKAGFIS